MPGTPETILAFDFGLRRIGVAVGQQVTDSASPLGIVRNDENGPDWAGIGNFIREWRPARLIVGMPSHADGSTSEIATVVRSFIGELGRFDLPIEAVDERYSSVEAEVRLKAQRTEGLRGRIRKEMIDAAAAVLIAERWLKNEHQ
jgi:putative Holliday junction resolvase